MLLTHHRNNVAPLKLDYSLTISVRQIAAMDLEWDEGGVDEDLLRELEQQALNNLQKV